MNKLNEHRADCLSWDNYFMSIARLSAMRSKDPSTQVGACLVSEDNRILSVGYNGTPNGFDDACFPWKSPYKSYDKYLYVIHAERNAIANYRGNRSDLIGAKIYVDLFPCNECAKEIIQSGIKEVVFLSDKYSEIDIVKAAKILFDVCGITYRQLTNYTEKLV